MSYDDIVTQQLMVEDRVRTEAYRTAIAQVVQPGQRVLDFGCGTGILSFFAARAGAEQVYAIDRSKFVRVARELARFNQLETVKYFHDDEATLVLDEKVDVIISEWMGHFVFWEQMLEPLVRLRDRFLAPEGTLIPQGITLEAALVTGESLHRDLATLHGQPYGYDLDFVAGWPFHQPRLVKANPGQLWPEVLRLGVLDMLTVTGPPEQLAASVYLDSPMPVYGAVGWFRAELTGSVSLGTGPWDPPTHWQQVYFPLERALEVDPGSPVELVLEPTFPSDGPRWRWSISCGGKSVKMDDFVHRAWLARDLPSGRLDE